MLHQTSILDFFKCNESVTAGSFFSILGNLQTHHSELCRLRQECNQKWYVSVCVCTHFLFCPSVVTQHHFDSFFFTQKHSSKHQTHSPVIGTKVGQQSGLLGDQISASSMTLQGVKISIDLLNSVVHCLSSLLQLFYFIYVYFSVFLFLFPLLSSHTNVNTQGHITPFLQISLFLKVITTLHLATALFPG